MYFFKYSPTVPMVDIKTLYHEKQYRNYCRCHALHNLFGKKLVSYTDFDRLCDEFDRMHKYDVGTSRRNYYFINNGGTDNIFGHVLQSKQIAVGMNHYDYYRTKQIKLHPKSIGLLLYSHSHTYCARLIDGKLYKIDSMQRRIQEIPLNILQRRGIGVIDVFRL